MSLISKLSICLALAITLHAEDAKPLATIEQLQAKVADQQKEMAAKDQQIATLSQKLTIYQQSAFRCQDAMLDAQIDAQARQAKPGEQKPKP